jgi:sulfite exporter TauE/SafE
MGALATWRFTVGIGTSLFLIAVGAVLRFAVTVSTRGFNVHTVGVILMIVGVVGLLISLLWMTTWRSRRVAGPGRADYVERDVPPANTY